ncbi:DEAD/DEAH box helicase family protein [Nocardioides sp. JQ2195]|uniref:DEAD/DEAH box helicase family protein n=1 Tax=Nocardioides sp. JQ2195 TaxID=2592334 RepID=UPI00143EADE0|nr:DEAD/DEAH box helicase family protein [Nocardioides sp. JQ2195]QIX27257.1 DEAD/DEAH box helicase family protein [Nocardioides sp. JQ2195]
MPAAVPPPLRRHQREALDVLEAAWAAGRTRTWVVLPPGAGKTRVGLEAVRRAPGTGRAVVFGPNTAIQSQWERQAHDFGLEAGTGRDLGHELSALTYQSLAVFDADQEVDDEGEEASLLARLHDNGRALVGRLREAGPILLVLDECHHLLEVWGRLLEELLAELPEARVLGLTATPPDALTRDQAALVRGMFGESLYQASIPAVVREGDLAPYAEMVWLTTPTAVEREWLRSEAERFTGLVTDLLDPEFASIGFLTWLDLRFLSEQVAWHSLQKRDQELCDAALRMHHKGLLALPIGARMGEQHRRDPTPDDWVTLIEDWITKALRPGEDDRDAAAVRAVRRALPSVGFVWTRRGIRRGRTPVDRVLARSAAKMRAAVEIVTHEHAALGERMRTLVLCDHERASAMLPADLTGVLDQQSGSAHAVLAGLVADPTTAVMHPLMVTGSTVAGGAETLQHLREHAIAEGITGLQIEEVADGACQLAGAWTSRTWVRVVTHFFQAGHCQVLVGTRALLGEGWDARRITGLVDLTAVTTTTAVVQTRGRALRVDPQWGGKVAINWSVVCVADDHPKAHNDWDRLVRKHRGFLAIDDDGDIVDGVAHIDPELSPFAPPAPDDFDAVNARMLVRAQGRADLRAQWRVGEPYQDVFAHTVRILPDPSRLGGAVEPVPVALTAESITPLANGPLRPSSTPVHVGLVLAGLTFAAGLLTQSLLPVAVGLVLGVVAWLVGDHRTTTYGRQLLAAASRPPGVSQIACAVAETMRALGRASVGADGVVVEIDHRGRYRCHLSGVAEPESAAFATALDEAVSPIADPRYVVPRWVVAPGRTDRGRARLAVLGGLQADGVVWHAVPTAFGRRAKDARAYADAWAHWVGGGDPVFTRSPEGVGILAAQRGADPFNAATVIRRHWG